MGDREDAGVRGHKMRVGRGGLSSRGQEIKKNGELRDRERDNY